MARPSRYFAVAGLWLGGLTATVFGQDAAAPMPPLKGHSLHAEVFNEGPRQKAYLMPGMANIQFAITTSNPEAQKFFNQGVSQLHGFWYYEAERSFRQVAVLDKDCGMAYWGMAMANLQNEGRAKKFLEHGAKLRDKLTERERMYFDALQTFVNAPRDGEKNKARHEAYTRALERILYKFPEDVEGRSLLAVQLWKNRDAELPISSYIAVDAILDQIFLANPMHPAHHYRIHLWDQERSEKALTSASKCGQSAPGIAHMWHMSGHIYSGQKRYDDACFQQEASARVDHAHMMRDRVLPDQIHNYAHNNEWLVRNLLHVGRLKDAIELAKNLTELPRHPKYNSFDRQGSAKYGRERLVEAFSTYEDWDQLLAMAATPYLEPTSDEKEQIEQMRFVGRAHYRRGNVAAADVILAELQKAHADQRLVQSKAVAEAEAKAKAENKNPDETKKLKDEAQNKNQGRLTEQQRAIDELLGYQMVAAGKIQEGHDQIKKSGRADRGYLAQLLFKTDKKDEALKQALEYRDNNKQEVVPSAVYVSMLWDAGKKDEARAAFEELRKISGSIDELALASPPLKRLEPIAKELQLPADWRVKQPVATDVGDRPALDTLGPFRWQPSAAPGFQLKDHAGMEHSLAQYKGKPVVAIFFLGHGCLHCAQQLQAFAGAKKDFDDAGLNLIAISSDDAEGLKMSIENYTGGPFPLPLVSDGTLETFKAYRCFDDFENQPLHGTFIIDANGLVRWQDISFEPFMDHKFVIQEAKRTLTQVPIVPASPAPGSPATVAAQ
ncbi:MAG: redoxin domain-containing protein [Planctomycetaceae bacterium]